MTLGAPVLIIQLNGRFLSSSGRAVQRRNRSQHNSKDSNRTTVSGTKEVSSLAVGRAASPGPLVGLVARAAPELTGDAADPRRRLPPPDESCRQWRSGSEENQKPVQPQRFEPHRRFRRRGSLLARSRPGSPTVTPTTGRTCSSQAGGQCS